MSFYDAHPHWFILILGLMFLPRVTLVWMLLFTNFVSGGWLWWLGFIFCPRLLIAFLSLPYWGTNAVLVFGAWLCALGGETAEKSVAVKVA
jgi:hypothetical protein